MHVVGGSAVFHKYMYILYLLFKSKDKSHGGRGLVMLQKQQDKRSHVGVWQRVEGEMQPYRERESDVDREKKVGASLYAY